MKIRYVYACTQFRNGFKLVNWIWFLHCLRNQREFLKGNIVIGTVQTRGSISTTHNAHTYSNDYVEFQFEFWLFIRFRRCSQNPAQKKGKTEIFIIHFVSILHIVGRIFEQLCSTSSQWIHLQNAHFVLHSILNSNSTNRIDWTACVWTEMCVFKRVVHYIMLRYSSNWIIFGVYSRNRNMKSNCYGKHWLIIARFKRQNQASVDCWPPVGTLSLEINLHCLFAVTPNRK